MLRASTFATSWLRRTGRWTAFAVCAVSRWLASRSLIASARSAYASLRADSGGPPPRETGAEASHLRSGLARSSVLSAKPVLRWIMSLSLAIGSVPLSSGFNTMEAAAWHWISLARRRRHMDERDTVWTRVHANGTIAVVSLREEKYAIAIAPNYGPVSLTALRGPLERVQRIADHESRCAQPCNCPPWTEKS
jgi:hypothetical protein